jgi:hypothetical protein
MSNPKIEEGSLLEYWNKDETIPTATRLEIESSPELMALAKQLRAADLSLTRILARSTCPSPHTLGEFQHGLLDEEEARRIARHSSDCPHCSREIAQIVEFMDLVKADVDPGMVERFKRIVAELISRPPDFEAGPPWAMPAAFGVRGHEESRSWVYQAGDYQIALMVDDDLEAPGRMQLTGLITGPEIEGWRAELQQAGKILQVVPVDEFGNFEMVGMNLGKYGIHFIGGALALSIQEFLI